ncbi:elongator complex protein 3 [Clostridium rectalis]|uniref:elongator complex protein 3 n=1 Tax=Clostridium rectalis TaxID=2040295 RepID=UPI000F642BF2|nr:radical SAM protein [Clostridium rectalis]
MSKSHYIIPIFVPHEGCPHNCVFCNQNAITGSKNIVNYKYTKGIIENYLKTIKIVRDTTIEVSFFGGTFTAIPMEKQNELLSVAKEYKKNGRINYIRLSTRPDYINHDILMNLKKYSVDIIELGIQSLDEEVLIKSGRGHRAEDVKRASQLIKDYGFLLGHQIMLGLPGDNFKKDIETTEKIIKMAPEICRIYPSLVVKNTPMENMFLSKKYKPYSLEEAVKITKIVYGMLLANNIKVIRVGLQPTEEINLGKEVVAGPFHAAFRELVDSSILNDILFEQLVNEENKYITIEINSKDISKLYSDKKRFFSDTISKLNTSRVNVIQNRSINSGDIIIKTDKKCKKISISQYILNKYKEGYFNLL